MFEESARRSNYKESLNSDSIDLLKLTISHLINYINCIYMAALCMMRCKASIPVLLIYSNSGF